VRLAFTLTPPLETVRVYVVVDNGVVVTVPAFPILAVILEEPTPEVPITPVPLLMYAVRVTEEP
jgi:hypothetical protein